MQEAEYTIGKAMEVQLKDGTLILCKPGDPFPANAQFSNHEQWVRHGYLVPTKNFVHKPRGPVESVPMRASTAADIERAKPTPVPGPDEKLSSIPGADNFVPASPKKVTKADLDALTKSDLTKLAADSGIEIERGATKTEIVRALLDAQG